MNLRRTMGQTGLRISNHKVTHKCILSSKSLLTHHSSCNHNFSCLWHVRLKLHMPRWKMHLPCLDIFHWFHHSYIILNLLHHTFLRHPVLFTLKIFVWWMYCLYFNKRYWKYYLLKTAVCSKYYLLKTAVWWMHCLYTLKGVENTIYWLLKTSVCSTYHLLKMIHFFNEFWLSFVT